MKQFCEVKVEIVGAKIGHCKISNSYIQVFEKFKIIFFLQNRAASQYM